MPYIIDGHNLIPKLGLSLDDPQDELKLIERLQVFCRLKKTNVEIFFDGGVAGQPATRNYGNVKAHFVRNRKQANEADAAIEKRLINLDRSARNWTVVSSDRRVLAAAREMRARVITSDEFSLMVNEAATTQAYQEKGDTNLSPEDVSEWMDVFDPSKPKSSHQQ